MELIINPTLFWSTFALIFVAEFPDKTALTTLLMATKNRPSAVFLGAALAFVIQSFVAVSFGSLFALLPTRWVQIGAGALFLILAIAMWRRPAEKEQATAVKRGFWRTVWMSFIVIFVAEWGDLTQLATAGLAARHREPFTIFLSATAALWAVTGVAVIAGSRLKHALHPVLLQRVAAIAFAAVGAWMLYRGLTLEPA